RYPDRREGACPAAAGEDPGGLHRMAGSTRRCDVVVLGAGIIGTSAAVQLQKRGRSVVLIDRRDPGQETSYGNAGLIQRDGFYPFGFPRKPRLLLRYALNKSPEVRYHPLALPGLAPLLFRYWQNSGDRSL